MLILGYIRMVNWRLYFLYDLCDLIFLFVFMWSLFNDDCVCKLLFVVDVIVKSCIILFIYFNVEVIL